MRRRVGNECAVDGGKIVLELPRGSRLDQAGTAGSGLVDVSMPADPR